MLAHQLILPSLHCHRLHHRIESRAKQPGPGRYDYCLVCTMGYEMAMHQFNDPDQADAFVQELRRAPSPSPSLS